MDERLAIYKRVTENNHARTGCPTGYPTQDVPHRMSRTGCPAQDVHIGCPARGTSHNKE
jgi:hypothetical protein